jgi:hypothetical protein
MHGLTGSKPRLFGTDGIRGTANLELTPELALRVGYAAVKVLADEKAGPFLVVGRDTRISGSMLESALVAGICSAGGRVELLGVIPTPAVAFLTTKKKADAGLAKRLPTRPSATTIAITNANFFIRCLLDQTDLVFQGDERPFFSYHISFAVSSYALYLVGEPQ